MASLADYEAAYALAGEVLRETLTDVKRPLREAFQRIQSLAAKAEGSVSRREIREALGVPDSTVRRWLADLVELEYLEPEASKGGQGKAPVTGSRSARRTRISSSGCSPPTIVRSRLLRIEPRHFATNSPRPVAGLSLDR